MLIDGLTIAKTGQTINMTLPSGSSFPSEPNDGELFFNTIESKPFIYSNGGWTSIQGRGAVGTASSRFLGSFNSLADITNPNTGDIAHALDPGDFRYTALNKYVYVDDTWVPFSNRVSTTFENIITASGTPKVGELFMILGDNLGSNAAIGRDLSGWVASINGGQGSCSFGIFVKTTRIETNTNGTSLGSVRREYRIGRIEFSGTSPYGVVISEWDTNMSDQTFIARIGTVYSTPISQELYSTNSVISGVLNNTIFYLKTLSNTFTAPCHVTVSAKFIGEI